MRLMFGTQSSILLFFTRFPKMGITDYREHCLRRTATVWDMWPKLVTGYYWMRTANPRFSWTATQSSTAERLRHICGWPSSWLPRLRLLS